MAIKRNQTSPAGLLRTAIRVALVLEEAGSAKALRKPLQVAGYGFLVRNRRLAQAIARAGKQSAYESRVLLRSMLEIQINYAWIRLRNTHSRALRFHNYWSLERLRLLEKTRTIFLADDYAQRRRALIADRKKVRHLFRFRDKTGKMQWAQSWASVSSVESRLSEVLKKEKPNKALDPFMYGMYVSFSSATHGSPNSLVEVLDVIQGRLVPKKQPERRPALHYTGALILLAWTIEAFARDARLRRQCARTINPIAKTLAAMAKEAAAKWE